MFSLKKTMALSDSQFACLNFFKYIKLMLPHFNLCVYTVDENCGRDVINKEVQYNDTHAGLRYNCTINKPLKQTSCIPTCTISQTPVVCQVHKNIRRRKGFTCVLYRDGDQADPFETPVEYSYSAIFEEMVTSGCQCYVENS